MDRNKDNSRLLRPAVFLDRDGTINVEKEYLYRIEDFEFITGAPESIKRLKDAGYLVIVVTNQSGVARGFYSLEDVNKLHRHIQAELAKFGTTVDAFYSCPHHPSDGVNEYVGECECRKPKPGMLLQAAEEIGVDLGNSHMVGDKIADVVAGITAGCKSSSLVMTGHGVSAEKGEVPFGVLVCKNIDFAVDKIVNFKSF